MNPRWLASLVCGLPLAAWASGAAGNEPEQGALSRAGQARPDFSGDWQLNAKASDDPQEKLREAMQASRQTGGDMGRGGGGGGMGRGGGGGGGMGRGGMGGTGGSPAEFAAQLRPPQALHIAHADPMLQISDENERSQRLFTDFRGGSVSAGGGLEQRVSVAGWEGPVLVVETTMLGKKLVQQYAIDRASGKLVVTTQAQGTLGRRLVEGARRVRIFGEDVAVRAGIHTVVGLSAHADQPALLAWAAGFRAPPRQAFVVHGEPDAALAFAEKLRALPGWQVTVPESGMTVQWPAHDEGTRDG